MAVATWSSSAGLVKAVVLPLILVLLAVAAGASTMEDGPAVAKSGGRFLETSAGRKLLATFNNCGLGSAPNYSCKTLLLGAKNATCCNDLVLPNVLTCYDVGGSDVFHCGSCTTMCKAGNYCCSGVCINPLTDPNNCGLCGRKCKSPNSKCILGFCGY